MSETTVRQSARQAQPLDGPDAQALEGALQQAERKLAAANERAKRLERALRMIANFTSYEIGESLASIARAKGGSDDQG